MEPRVVRKLEKRLYEAIADVICDMGLKKLPLLPSQHTMEMMANRPSDEMRPVVAENDPILTLRSRPLN